MYMHKATTSVRVGLSDAIHPPDKSAGILVNIYHSSIFLPTDNELLSVPRATPWFRPWVQQVNFSLI